ncbi:hypothetical protein L9F63_012018, partial [Diploptera punctata]
QNLKSEAVVAVCNNLGPDVACLKETPESTWDTNPWDRKKYLNLSDVPVYSPSIGAGVDITSDGEVHHTENSSSNMFYQETHFDLSNNIVHVSEPSASESMESEFVRIPKSEYEAIKNRVSAIESRISQEFGNMAATNQNNSNLVSSLDLPCDKEVTSNNAESVQTAYEKTLEESEKLDDTSTDQLARRLSKELRIRRSLEHKIIRSPSARKIGTIKRRSRENAKPMQKKQSERNEISRNMSWHLAIRPSVSQINQLYPRSSLRRGRPNTVFSGLPQPHPIINMADDESTRITLKYQHSQNSTDDKTKHVQNFANNEAMNMTDFSKYLSLCKDLEGPLTRNRAQRAYSFSGSEWSYRNQNFVSDCSTEVEKSNSQYDLEQSATQNCQTLQEIRKEEKNEHGNWKTAETFFNSNEDPNQEVPVTGRASIAKLRSQNAGMVMQRMKMFDPKVNPKVDSSEKDRNKVECKSKKTIHVPSVFARNAETAMLIQTQSSSRSTPSKKQCHGQNFQRVHSSMRSKTGNMRETYKDSPKKIGTPRRKQSMKSPNGSLRRQKLKILKSPSTVNPDYSSPTTNIKRKHNSLKMSRDKVYSSVKANLSAPDHWLPLEKENFQSPADNVLQTNLKSLNRREAKDATVNTADICSPSVEKSSKIIISPLKDNNRIRNNMCSSNKEQTLEKCSGYVETPFIKKPLLTKSPSHFTKTPQSILMSSDRNGRRQITPMKALADFSTVATPVGFTKRQSPRLLLKSRNIS